MKVRCTSGAGFALGLRQFALGEWKSNLANDVAIIFRQIWAAGEIHFLVSRIIQTATYLVSLESYRITPNSRAGRGIMTLGGAAKGYCLQEVLHSKIRLSEMSVY